jgi:tRNA pseudouridine-54 N-methylase
VVVLFHDVSAPTAAGLFSVSNLLQGRVDVWCRCVTAALYLSDDLRRDTVVSLVLSPPSSEEKHEKEFPIDIDINRTRVVTVRGDEVEGLAPAETRVALLLQRATQHASLGALGELGREAKAAAARAANRDEDEKGEAREKKSARNASRRRARWVAQRPGSAGPVPGITVTDYPNTETCLNAVCDALGGGPGSILLLDAAGAPFATRALGKEKRASADATTFVLGDATGITKHERELLMRQDGISTVALGPRVLLASHCIVLAHAALDNV